MQKRQRMIDKMLGAAGSVTREPVMKEEDHVMEVVDVMKSAAFPELCLQVPEEIRKV